ncbi:MAG: T9SS type A sorting domain-containing protein [Bacteroidia bacterium]|nr:T9SS type A sorting domain-containing protein [Bacteroidia bacterium]
MKLKSTIKGMLAAAAFLSSGVLGACDLSSFTLNGVTNLGNNKYKIDITFCAGGGKSSTRYGADQMTTNFAFYLSQNATVDTMDKLFLKSPMTGDTLWAEKFIDDSKISVAYDASVLYYLSPQWNKVWACIKPTCGAVQTVCGSLSIITNGLPDSIWCRGMEAAGNIRGGCTKLYVFPRCYYTTLTASLGADKLVYKGYSPTCATLAPAATGGSGSYTYSWSNGSTASSQSVCPTVATSYWVKVTDGYGCSKRDTVVVNIKDVRCGSNFNKVSLCYNNSNKCVSNSSAAYYLNLGATLGACGSAAYNPDANAAEDVETAFDFYPNPASAEFTIESALKGNYKIGIYNIEGQLIKSVFEGEYVADEKVIFDLQVVEFSKGVYIIRTTGTSITGEAIAISKKLVIQ